MNNDLISRSNLKEFKILPFDTVPDCHKPKFSIVASYQQGWNDAIDRVIDNAPTVTPQAFINGIVELISKNGITTIDELLETLKGGAE